MKADLEDVDKLLENFGFIRIGDRAWMIVDEDESVLLVFLSKKDDGVWVYRLPSAEIPKQLADRIDKEKLESILFVLDEKVNEDGEI